MQILLLVRYYMNTRTLFTGKFDSYKGKFRKMVRKILLISALIILAILLVGCQTVQGLGGDIKWTGEKGAEILER